MNKTYFKKLILTVSKGEQMIFYKLLCAINVKLNLKIYDLLHKLVVVFMTAKFLVDKSI